VAGLCGQLPSVLLDSLGGTQEADDGFFPLSALIRRPPGGLTAGVHPHRHVLPSSVPHAPITTPANGSTVGPTDAQLISMMMQVSSTPPLAPAAPSLVSGKTGPGVAGDGVSHPVVPYATMFRSRSAVRRDQAAADRSAGPYAESTRTCRSPGGRAHTGTVVLMADVGVVVWYNHDLFSVK
jgi:hypothetical protein